MIPELKGHIFNVKGLRTDGIETLTIETSRKCNLRCVYCYAEADSQPLKDEMSTDEVCGVIKQAKDLGAKSIVMIGGGELLMCKDALKIVDYVNSLGMDCVAYTNATLVTKELAEELYKRNLSILCKIDSIVPKTRDDLAGVPNAHKLMECGIQNLIDAGFAKETPSRLGTVCVVNRKNYDEVPGIFRYCRDNNIVIRMEVIGYAGRAKELGLNLEKDEVRSLSREICRIDKQEYGNDPEPNQPELLSACTLFYYSLAVTADGTVQPCTTCNFDMGNVRQVTLKQVLESDKGKMIRNIKEHLTGKCRECEKECYGCRANALNMKGSVLASDPCCIRQEKVGCKFGGD